MEVEMDDQGNIDDQEHNSFAVVLNGGMNE